ncbi:MSHA biogenesis protein MshC [Pseudoduganella albidiflava]|uniref:Prepilin-type N-terminal cleavage/methylation domain-containing protein n=1 Tax=Pseudoduganella albidiflava TaxID=321983 RepID=A0AA88C2L3_9BURK|nr:MSHA biogenesis protein MshC [Pseudoduganella albidiflava]GGY38624.1 hypothetical protein GCM10007387_20790 [Pseudoduganella albidiflava]
MTTAKPIRPVSRLPRPRAGQFGFTLVELVLILLIVGILGAVAAPRFFEQRTFDVAGFSQQTTALIRLAQKQAIAQNRNVYVRLDGNSVALCYDTGCNGKVPAPANSNSGSATTLARCGNLTTWACEGIPNGLAITAAPMFYFDPAGKPFNASDGDSVVNSTFVARLAVRVSGGGISQDTVIEPETGFTR